MYRLPIANGFSAIQNNSDLSQGRSRRLMALSTARTAGISMVLSIRRE
jgi:hypothetical protein